MPRPVRAGITQSPTFTVLTDWPAERTSKQASLPGMAVGVGVPRVVVNGGRAG